jgi:hypothetical protein
MEGVGAASWSPPLSAIWKDCYIFGAGEGGRKDPAQRPPEMVKEEEVGT